MKRALTAAVVLAGLVALMLAFCFWVVPHLGFAAGEQRIAESRFAGGAPPWGA